MPKQLLIYERAEPVSPQRHGDLAIRTGSNFSFASKVNSVPLMAAEFPHAAAEMAVVFAGQGDDIIPVVLLGVRDDENLFVGKDGAWQGNYVPAFLRRYPFVFSSSDDGDNFTLCVDEEFEGANREGRGERLFDNDGERTQYLQGVLGFLQAYQVQFQRTQAFTRRLSELGLLEPMQARFTLRNGSVLTLGGFQAVNREKLKALNGEQLAILNSQDELELLFLHLASLRHLTSTAERIGAGAEGESVATEEAPTAPETSPAKLDA
ncbi:SapC family protein [Devosia aurantiaca]|uniref:SapC family protein n=1 Tax=Devosia aurantiaca TaxID=2714858 RepID=A0A6M1SN69_9HYPH|nr:SapC family protein [Devosia aurantiaca]NGP18570.1 SapC family protein [Devosia aurantiaca]